MAARDRNPDDVWADHVRAECAKAVGEWLEGSVRLERPVRSLTSSELQGIAEAATSRWIVLASQRMAQAPDASGSPRLSTLLLG
ncbi:hypothetical protein [Rhodoplanes roseus]|uniref:Uncharacterized protein n=1 Tax=Rhodoplanes roseus TaxID=29409 RepID=A0A327L6I6_9BRAD|nr:hypothetical protein [Rhodoplanes roseus]RAI46171.1 hypothetical protein CH341_00265 [Rhodoplanes roseus]